MRARLGLREWGIGEYGAALGAVLGLRRQPVAAQRVEHWFSEAFGRTALALNGGRAAVRIALHCLQEASSSRDEVIVPALVCPALVRAVLDSGLRPVFADIGENLNTPVDTVRAVLSPRTLAVVMVHAYGHPADAPGLTRLCDERSVALIDDAAQRVDPSSGLGLAGDFGVFSFAQSKSVVTGIDGSGGVLLLNHARHRTAAIARVAALPAADRRHLAWLEFALTPRFPRLAYYVARWRHRRRRGAPLPAQIAALDGAIALIQLGSIEQRRARRLQQLRWYQDALRRAGIAAPQLGMDGTVDYLARLLVRVPAAARDDCRRSLSVLGADTRLPYALPGQVTADFHPVAWAASQELLELPLSPGLSETDVEAIVTALAETIASGSKRPAGGDVPSVIHRREFESNDGRRECSTTGN